MLQGEPFMWHSLLSSSLNLGLLDPLECVEAAERAYRDGDAPIASVEGFVRQIIGWREYVWGMYWLEGERWERMNALRRRRATLPAALWGGGDRDALRLRVVGSLRGDRLRAPHRAAHGARQPACCSPASSRERRSTGSTARYVDGYEWVMAPNVLGHGHVGRRRPDDEQAVCSRRPLRRPDVRPLRLMPLPARPAHRRGCLPVLDDVLGLPRPQRGAARGHPQAPLAAPPTRPDRCR